MIVEFQYLINNLNPTLPCDICIKGPGDLDVHIFDGREGIILPATEGLQESPS
jgi:hypothetical protein